jgi:hypothetical protein
MAVYYVGPGGNNANNGTSWALRKLTLGGAEAVVAAGDTVWVAPGVYRETLTVATSGSAGNPIVYAGDYTGANTDGVGGVVRITGSDNDQTATRASCIHDGNTQRNYRTFQGFLLDTVTGNPIYGQAGGTNWIVQHCNIINTSNAAGIYVLTANQAAWTVRNCNIWSLFGGNASHGIQFSHSATVDNAGHVVENCILVGTGTGYRVFSSRIGGVMVRNCLLLCGNGIVLSPTVAAGQYLTVNNCIITGMNIALIGATADGAFVENYNSLFGNTTDRSNVSTGANSVAYVPLFDARWFFEAVNGGKMVTPFDLASYSQLVNLAGTSPTTADMRGTTVIGAQREWGPMEFDPALLIEAGSGGGGGRRRRLWMFGG